MTSGNLENFGRKGSRITVKAINHNFYATFVAPMKIKSITTILTLILSLSNAYAQDLLPTSTTGQIVRTHILLYHTQSLCRNGELKLSDYLNKINRYI